MARLKLTDCMDKAGPAIPRELKRALTAKTKALAASEGIHPTEAARRVVRELRDNVSADLEKVRASLPAAAPEPEGGGAESRHVMGVKERAGARTTVQSARYTPEERQELETKLEALLDKKEIPHGPERVALTKKYRRELAEDVVETRKRFPVSDGWMPLEVKDVTIARPKTGGEAVAKVDWKTSAYTYNQLSEGKTPRKGTSERAKLVEDMADELAGEVNEVRRRADDPNATPEDRRAAKVMLEQRGWYRNMTQILRQWWGGFADLYADLLGALSPNTDVDQNWRFAIAAMREAMTGNYDAILAHFDQWLKDGRSLKEYEDTKQPVIRQTSGKLYGMNSMHAMKAMLDIWRAVKEGTAPKARNFSRNLIGDSIKATIDVWAARYLQRAARNVARRQGRSVRNFARVPTVAEGAVGGDHADENTVRGAFGFGQDVFESAAAKLRDADPEFWQGITPADLQALLWFREKEHWNANRWSYKEGGSFEANADVQQIGRYVGGLSQERAAAPGRPRFRPSAAEQQAVGGPLQRTLAQLPGVFGARVKDSIGRFARKLEKAFDVEVLAGPEADPRAIADEVVRVGAAAGQKAVFVSRVLDANEESENWRPGLEVYFRGKVPESKLRPIMNMLRDHGFDGFTLIVDPRAEPPTGGGIPGEFTGIRFQWVPEFAEENYDQGVAMQKRRGLVDLQAKILAIKGVAHVGQINYDTLVLNDSEYDAAGNVKAGSGIRKRDAWTQRARDENDRRADTSTRAAAAHGLPTVYSGRPPGGAGAAGPGVRESLAPRGGPIEQAATQQVAQRVDDTRAVEAVASDMREAMPAGPAIRTARTEDVAAQFEARGDPATAAQIRNEAAGGFLRHRPRRGDPDPREHPPSPWRSNRGRRAASHHARGSRARRHRAPLPGRPARGAIRGDHGRRVRPDFRPGFRRSLFQPARIRESRRAGALVWIRRDDSGGPGRHRGGAFRPPGRGSQPPELVRCRDRETHRAAARPRLSRLDRRRYPHAPGPRPRPARARPQRRAPERRRGALCESDERYLRQSRARARVRHQREGRHRRGPEREGAREGDLQPDHQRRDARGRRRPHQYQGRHRLQLHPHRADEYSQPGPRSTLPRASISPSACKQPGETRSPPPSTIPWPRKPPPRARRSSNSRS